MIIGLTGSSGSGKGAVSEIMAKQGALVLDCDNIAHKNMEPSGAAYGEIINAFGKEILNEDNTINRKILGQIVFNDSEKLKLLNNITHKYITKVINDTIAKSDNKLVVIDAPLLIEAGLNELCDRVWAVYAPDEIRLERVMKRDNIDKERALMRFKNQMPFDKIKEYAHTIIENTAGINELEKKVVNELRELL